MYSTRKIAKYKFQVIYEPSDGSPYIVVDDKIYQTQGEATKAKHKIIKKHKELLNAGQAEDIPLSNYDIYDLLKEAKIETPNIIKSWNIRPGQDIFQNCGHAIIFHRWSKDVDIGHWIVCVRNKKNNEIIYFDSLATPINDVSKYLKDVLLAYNMPVYINTIKYQGDESSVCGRWCLFIICLNKIGYNHQQIYDILEKLKTEYKTLDDYLLEMF